MVEHDTKHISKEEVERIAWLARIEISEKEIELFTEQFNEILDYFQIIDKAPTEKVSPTQHILDLTNVLREDKIELSLPRDKALKNAPMKEEGYFKAPKIM